MSQTNLTKPRSVSNASNHSDYTQYCHINKQSYVKLISHAFKYPANTLFGLVLGTYNNNIPTITDTLPLYHTVSLNLSSINELTLMLIDTYCTQQNAQIIGVYIIPHTIDITPQHTIQLATHIANKLYELNKNLLILTIEQTELQNVLSSKVVDDNSGAIHIYQRNDRKQWIESVYTANVDTDAITSTQKLLLNINYDKTAQPQYMQLCDMDDHLSDPSKDPFNNKYNIT